MSDPADKAATRKRRIAICDDSPAFSEALRRYLHRDPTLEVVAVYPRAEPLLDQLDSLAPDLVTMDLEMPGLGGRRAIEEIMRSQPVPILVLSGHAERGSEQAAAALTAGAMEAMPKTALHIGEPDSLWATAARSRIKRLATLQLRRPALTGATRPPPAGRASLDGAARVVAIGASTGGPPALATLLGCLPADFPVPILIVQHMPADFIGGLAQWLDGSVAISVGVAERSSSLQRGAWFAPGGSHLLLDSSFRLDLDPDTVKGPHRPSVDALFGSVAAAAGPDAVGVVLTGMGSDGGEGTAALVQAGGVVIAQDEPTSAVYGMPKVAAEAGARLILPLQEIAGTLAGLRSGAAR